MNKFLKMRFRPVQYLFSVGLLCAALIACNQSTDVSQQPDDSSGLVPASANTHQHPLPSLSNQPAPNVDVGKVDGPQLGREVATKTGINTRVSARFSPGTAPKVKLKLLVVSATTWESGFQAITTFLKQIGVPFDTLIASTTNLTSNFLETDAGIGNYNGVLLTTADLVYDAANNPPNYSLPLNPSNLVAPFDATEWSLLRSYESQYKAREVDLYSYPDGTNNSNPGNTGLVVTGAVDTTAAPLNAQLSVKGQQIFP